MKILLINSLFPPLAFGGSEESTSELAHELAGLGHAVFVVTLVPAGDMQSTRKEGSVTVIELASSSIDPFMPDNPRRSVLARTIWQLREIYRPRLGRRLTNVVSTIDPDIVHTNLISGFGNVAWLSAAGRALIHTLRDHYLICVHANLLRDGQICNLSCLDCSVGRLRFERLRDRPAVYVGVSSDILAAHVDAGFIPETYPMAVIGNRPSKSRTSNRSVLSSPSDGLTFGFIGKIATYKGVWLALEAFSQVALPNAKFLIAGGASQEDRARLEEVVAGDKRIRYLGRVESDEFYAKVDIVAIPSQWREPFGRVAHEAAASGCTVVVSAVGGLPEAVGKYPHQILVTDISNAAAWASAFGRAAQLHSERSCSTFLPEVAWPTDGQRVADEYLNVYRKAYSSLWGVDVD